MNAFNIPLRILLVLGLVALGAAPLWASNNLTRIFGEGLVLAALAVLWNMLAGFAGRVSVGQQAFVGIGAYAALSLCLNAAVPPLLAIPAAGIVGAVLSLPIALIVFRLRGHYFAIGTWAVAEILRLTVMQIPALGGGSGTSLPASMLKAISPERGMRADLIYLAGFAVFAVVLGASVGLMRSRWGLALRAMRDSELAAESLGLKLGPLRLAVYCGVGGLTAAVGAVILLQKLRVSPDAAFSVQDWTAFVLFIAVIGGVGTLEGPILGTVLFMLLREFLADYGPAYLIVLGLIAVLVMLAAPRGLWGWLGPKGLSLLPDRHFPPKEQSMPLSETDLDAAARALYEADASRKVIAQLSKTWPSMTLEDSYEVQRRWIALRVADGARVIGRKIGLTSRAMQQASKMTEPDYGVMLDDATFRDGARIPAGRFIKPRLEVELAFVMGEDLKGAGCQMHDVMRATEFVTPALEIIDYRTEVPRAIVDTIADNAAFGAIVLGGRIFRPFDLDLRWVSAALSKNGVIEETGVSAGIMGHPAAGVAWLVNKLAAQDDGLKKGDIVLGGSFTRPVDIASGDVVQADYGPLGSIGVSFE